MNFWDQTVHFNSLQRVPENDYDFCTLAKKIQLSGRIEFKADKYGNFQCSKVGVLL